MKHMLFRFGVPCVFLIMLIGIAVMLNTLRIRIKRPVTIIRIEGQHIMYIPGHEDLYHKGDTLHIEQTATGTLCVRINTVTAEPEYIRLDVTPIGDTMHPTTMQTGYIHSRSVRLLELIFHLRETE